MRFWHLIALSGSLSVPAAAAPVQTTTLTYHGWPHAVRLSNGVVDVIVVPSIGRIMSFSLHGRPDTNPIFNNPAERGRPAPPAQPYPKQWTNYGGDRIWPSPQSEWAQHQPQAWPPDPAFDTGPYIVTSIPGGLRLVGPVSPYYGIRVIREITLPPHAAQMQIRDQFVRVHAGTGPGAAMPVGIWSVCQVRGDSQVFLPLDTHHAFPGSGYTRLMPKPKTSFLYWRVGDGLLTVTRPPTVSTKVGVDDRAGWIADLYRGDLLFSARFTRTPKAPYPDGGCDAEVYTNGDPTTPYIEMELLSPLATLRPGTTLTRSLTWSLQRLSRRPRSLSDARRLVRAALSRGRRR